jgi:xylulokinase
MPRYYIGFDCGTQGTKTAIYSDETQLIAEAYVEHPIRYPQPGWAEIDADAFYRAARDGIRAAVQQSKLDPAAVRGISCSGIICGLLPIDADWNPVGPFIPHLDTRSSAEALEIARQVEPLWVEESGNVDLETFVPAVMLRWLFKHRPELIARTAKVVTAAHYVLGKLGGLEARDAYIDWAHLSGWIVGYDARTRDWSQRQLDALHIPRELLPRVTRPWDVVGELTHAQAELLGLRPGIPLVAGAGDIMQSCLGSGVVEHGMCADITGTASIFAVDVGGINDAITRIPGVLYSLGTLPGHALYWGYLRAGGLSLRWYRDQIERGAGDAFYAELDALAAEVPAGADGVLFYPYLGGGDPALPHASGSWLNLYGSSGRATLWRSMLESIAFEYLAHAQTFRRHGIAIDELIGTGGGSRSALWNQIKADTLDARYLTLQRSEGAVLADALLAAYGVGDIPDLAAAAREWVAIKQSFAPRPEQTRRYAELFERRQAVLHGPLREAFRLLGEPLSREAAR